MPISFRIITLLCAVFTVITPLFAENLPDISAAEQGDANAQYNLGVYYYNGEGVDQDYVEAVKWYRKAAEQGFAEAQLQLGCCYYNGEGVDQDYAEAVKWFRMAAEQGFAIAQYNLGCCYRDEEGVAQDYIEAVKWFRVAAEQGFAAAQCNLGCCYYNGEGVAYDYTEAVKWVRKAAEQGDADAQQTLEQMSWPGYLINIITSSFFGRIACGGLLFITIRVIFGLAFQRAKERPSVRPSSPQGRTN